MILTQIIFLVLVVLFVFYLFKLLKNLLKAIMIGIFIVLLFFGIVLVATYHDYQQLKQQTPYIQVVQGEKPLFSVKVTEPNFKKFALAEAPKNATLIIIQWEYLKNHLPKSIETPLGNLSKATVIQGVEEKNTLLYPVVLLAYFQENLLTDFPQGMKEGNIMITPPLLTSRIVSSLP